MRKRKRYNIGMDSLFYHDECMNIIFSFNTCEQIHNWTKTCKILNRLVLKNSPEFYHLIKHKSLYQNLVHFCGEGNIQVIDYLYQKGVDFDDNREAFIMACKNGRLNVIHYFESKNIDLSHKIQIGFNVAAQNGYVNVLEHFLSKESIFYKTLVCHKHTCLGLKEPPCACECALPKESVFCKTSKNISMDLAMEFACKQGNDQVVECLLKNNISVCQQDLDCACTIGNLKLVKLLIPFGLNLHYALFRACLNSIEMIEFLLSQGAHAEWDSLLEYALFGNSKLDIIKWLISKGAHPNQLHLDTISRIYAFSNIENVEFLTTILSKEELNRGFVLVCKLGNLERAKFLFSKGVDIHYNENEAFHLACKHGRKEVVEFLVELGVDIYSDDHLLEHIFEIHWYDDELISVNLNVYMSIIKYLISKGANLNTNHQSSNNVSDSYHRIYSYLQSENL